MYRVLKPIYTKTGETTSDGDTTIHWHKVGGWKELGTARSMSEANEKFPRGSFNWHSHVLAPIGELH